MKIQRTTVTATFAIAALALVGCSAGPSPDGGTSNPDAGPAAPVSPGGGAGHATVTVDGQTWDYSSFMCVTGYEQTDSDLFSFSSTSYTTSDGEKIQFLVDVADPTGQDRLSGEGVTYHITVFDYENSDSPSVSIDAEGTTGVTISDNSIKVAGDFNQFDGSTVAIEAEAVCG